MKKFTMLMIALLAVAGFAQAAAEWRPTDVAEAALTGANRVYTVDYADLTTTDTNTAQTLTVSVPAKAAVQFVMMVLETAFDTGDTNYTGSLAVKVGDGTDDDLYLTSTELASDGSEVWKKFAVANGGTIAVTPQTISVAAAPVLTLAGVAMTDTNGVTATCLTNVTVATTAYTVATNATATYTAGVLGEKIYTAADTIDVVFTPNSEEAVSANTSGKVKFYFNVQ